ncbi:hypothetical protein J437_LFUL001149, partial [Ladona fulva]
GDTIVKSTVENIKSSRVSNKKSYFEKLKERVEMFHNQSFTLQKSKTESSSNDYAQTTIDHRAEPKISYDDVMSEQLVTPSKKRLKKGNLCDNDGTDEYKSPYFYAEPNEDFLFSDNDEYITDIQINDDGYQDYYYINTQGSFLSSSLRNNSSGLRNDVGYLDNLIQTCTNIKDVKDSPPLDHEYFSRNYDMEYYKEADRDATINATELEDNAESDVSSLKDCTLGEIQMPTFDLGEDDLLADESC